jgi:hypothetical protein
MTKLKLDMNRDFASTLKKQMVRPLHSIYLSLVLTRVLTDDMTSIRNCTRPRPALKSSTHCGRTWIQSRIACKRTLAKCWSVATRLNCSWTSRSSSSTCRDAGVVDFPPHLINLFIILSPQHASIRLCPVEQESAPALVVAKCQDDGRHWCALCGTSSVILPRGFGLLYSLFLLLFASACLLYWRCTLRRRRPNSLTTQNTTFFFFSHLVTLA